MQHGIAAVQLNFAERDFGVLLERRQVRLVMRVIEPARGASGRQPGKPVPDPAGRQVLDLAVVLVPAAVLAHLGNIQVADCAQPRAEIIHAGNATCTTRPGSLLAA